MKDEGPKLSQFPEAHALYKKLIDVINQNREGLSPLEVFSAVYATFYSTIEWCYEVKYPHTKVLAASAMEMLCNLFDRESLVLSCDNWECRIRNHFDGGPPCPCPCHR